MKKLKIPKGTIVPCNRYAERRLQLLKTWAIFVSQHETLSGSDYLRLSGDVDNLVYHYSLTTGTREIPVRCNSTPQELVALAWKLAPPFLECVGHDRNGNAKWLVRHTARVPIGGL